VSRLLDPDSLDRRHCEVFGVAELYGHLYVLQSKSKSIYVSLAEKPYSMLSDMPLDGVIEPTDLAASTFDNCLYVTDIGDCGCIWRVQVEERVTESTLDCKEMKLGRNVSELEGTSDESTRAETAQGCDEGCDGQVNEMNDTDTHTDCDAADGATSVAESASVTSICEKLPMSETQGEANKLPEPLVRDLDQHKQTDINLHELIRKISGCSEASVVNVTEAAQHSKSKSSKTEMEKMKDEDAGEMIRSLLERTGLMKKISERGNSSPCLYEVSRHYSVKRFLFAVNVIFSV